MNQLNYYLNFLKAVPFIPLLLRQAKHIRKTMPDLPAPEDVRLEVDENNFHVLSLGESSMASIGVDSQRHGITGFFSDFVNEAKKGPCSYEIAAKSGYRADQVKNELLSTINSPSADLILIGLGANDAFQMTTPKKWRSHIEEIVNHLRDRFAQTPIVFINMPPIKEFPIFTSLLKYFVQRQLFILKSELVDLVAPMEKVHVISHELTAVGLIQKYQLGHKQLNDFYSDGVHPSQLTYRLWAREIFEFTDKNKLF